MRPLLSLLLLALPLAAGPLEDFRAFLTSIEQHDILYDKTYSRIEALLLPWIESQLAAGSSVEQIEQQLKAAKLFNPNGTVGTVVGLTPQPIPGSELTALPIRLQYSKMGQELDGCGAIMPVLIYQASPYRRVLLISRKPEAKTMPLAPFAFLATPPDSSGQRFLASSWTISHCGTSFSATFRLQRLGQNGPPLWEKTANAKFHSDGDLIPTYESGTVYFPFFRPLLSEGGIDGHDLFVVRLNSGKLRDVSPPAGSIAALLCRWIDLKFPHASVQLESFSRCNSTTEVEMGITLDRQAHYVRIATVSANSLRVLKHSASPSCPSVLPFFRIASIADFLPPYSHLLKSQF